MTEQLAVPASHHEDLRPITAAEFRGAVALVLTAAAGYATIMLAFVR